MTELAATHRAIGHACCNLVCGHRSVRCMDPRHSTSQTANAKPMSGLLLGCLTAVPGARRSKDTVSVRNLHTRVLEASMQRAAYCWQPRVRRTQCLPRRCAFRCSGQLGSCLEKNVIQHQATFVLPSIFLPLICFLPHFGWDFHGTCVNQASNNSTVNAADAS